MTASLHPQPIITRLSSISGRANGGEHVTVFGRRLGHGDIESVRIGSQRAEVSRNRAKRKMSPRGLWECWNARRDAWCRAAFNLPLSTNLNSFTCITKLSFLPPTTHPFHFNTGTLTVSRAVQVLWADPRGRKIKIVTPSIDDENQGQTLDVTVHSHSRGIATLQKGFQAPQPSFSPVLIRVRIGVGVKHF